MKEFNAGRGVVELTIEKPDGADAYVVNEGGGPRPQAHLTQVQEGYNAPVTSGNFATNVMDKLYIGRTLTVDYTSILVGKGDVSGMLRQTRAKKAVLPVCANLVDLAHALP